MYFTTRRGSNLDFQPITHPVDHPASNGIQSELRVQYLLTTRKIDTSKQAIFTVNSEDQNVGPEEDECPSRIFFHS